MPLLTPSPPPYDPLEWRARPWPERTRMACQAWALQGYGTPVAIYALYLLKILFYVGMWCWFCSFTPGLGDWRAIGSWCFEPVAFQKAVLWSMAFEGLGLGCASGPLTARYWPPIGGCLHFLRPGTVKLPLVESLPLVGGTRRSWLHVLLYAAHYFFLLWALVAAQPNTSTYLPIVCLLALLGLADRTIFLASRSEHYHTTLVCFLFAGDWIAGAAAVQLAIWMWAAVSKLNHHFPAVICVMTSNSPATPWAWLRKRMYRSYPDDLRPSRLAVRLAHAGALFEFGFPVLLVAGDGGVATWVGLGLMACFHLYITSNFPMAVPIEWNVHVVYGAFFLFGHHAGVTPLDVGSPLLGAYLIGALVLVPLIGNLLPARVSFLMAMRYYAGNWAYGVWLFRRQGEAYRKLDRHIVKSARWIPDQLARFYDEGTIANLMGKVPAFRAMHLHGRALQLVLRRAVDDVDAYVHVDGELVAGMVLGWNFGEGHLHDERLLAAVQERCQFEEGDLRCVFVESQPLGGSTLAWRIVDARTGLADRGEVEVARLLELQPWPAAS